MTTWQLLGQELVPGLGSYREDDGKQSALTHNPAAGHPHGRNHPPVAMGGRQGSPEQVHPTRYLRSGHVRGAAGGLTEGELDETGRDLAGIDRLDTKASRHR